MTTAYRCPLCQSPLQPNPQGFGCEHNHQFDKAKEGYVNLLPVHKKKSKNPGDDPQMVLARRAFLAAGHYQFLQNLLIDNVNQLITGSGKHYHIVDSGCGEGYYTNKVAEHFPESSIYGIDIAKTAVRYGAKRADKAHFAVASSQNLPFAAQSIDILYKVFAPMFANEVKRVLKPNGYFISVVPGPMHLQQLREYIYQKVKPHQDEICPRGFKRIDSKNRHQNIILSTAADIEHLCKMTPFAWKLTPEAKNTLLNLEEFAIRFDFTINVYQLDIDGN